MNFEIGEMYYQPYGYELIRVLKMVDDYGTPMMRVKTLWSIRPQKTKKRNLSLASNYCNRMLDYEHSKLPIMKRIFE